MYTFHFQVSSLTGSKSVVQCAYLKTKNQRLYAYILLISCDDNLRYLLRSTKRKQASSHQRRLSRHVTMSAAASASKSIARGAIAQGAKLWPHKSPTLAVRLLSRACV